MSDGANAGANIGGQAAMGAGVGMMAGGPIGAAIGGTLGAGIGAATYFRGKSAAKKAAKMRDERLGKLRAAGAEWEQGTAADQAAQMEEAKGLAGEYTKGAEKSLGSYTADVQKALNARRGSLESGSAETQHALAQNQAGMQGTIADQNAASQHAGLVAAQDYGQQAAQEMNLRGQMAQSIPASAIMPQAQPNVMGSAPTDPRARAAFAKAMQRAAAVSAPGQQQTQLAEAQRQQANIGHTAQVGLAGVQGAGQRTGMNLGNQMGEIEMQGAEKRGGYAQQLAAAMNTRRLGEAKSQADLQTGMSATDFGHATSEALRNAQYQYGMTGVAQKGERNAAKRSFGTQLQTMG